MSVAFRQMQTLIAELLVLAGCLCVGAVAAAFYGFSDLGETVVLRAMLFALLATLATGLPFMLYASLRLQKLLKANSGLHRVAVTDPLTGVLNRKGFEAEFRRRMEAMNLRATQGGLAFFVVDADHFKRINDRLGHPVGDQALVGIAAALKRSLRGGDIVGRIGGEEFAIALNCTNQDSAALVAERIRATIARLSVGSGAARAPLSVSIGGSFSASAQTYAALYGQADANLYAAKKGGRNRVVLTAFKAEGGRYRLSAAGGHGLLAR
ncbi:GGDEF domain-containing protein [Aurantimonas sp. Leaf443]|uniref:GGDEF domain-containing protein n=1 Tax=Aurantimonas sp. Leaf443 TaxID=1736378 RepID=UPI0006FA386C|nr:GGDEF domain-containing protein [Aurantimonas sp. Leaf443]KQT83899.1 hypothetical protein ASG48_10920 [Aurantimonas sp. Leaf443]